MAFAPHFHFAFGGSLLASDQTTVLDIWSCNVNLIPAGGGSPDEATYLNQVATKLGPWFSAGEHGISALARLEFAKFNAVAASGRYTNPGTSFRYDFTPPVQGGAAPNNPEIISLATSWITTKQRGPGSHGRIFLPNPTYGTPAGMTVPTADQDKAVAAGVALLQLLNNTDPDPTTPPSDAVVMIPVVASKVDASNTDIIGVRVGSVKDVQRRRKNAVVETYRNGIFLAATS